MGTSELPGLSGGSPVFPDQCAGMVNAPSNNKGRPIAHDSAARQVGRMAGGWPFFPKETYFWSRKRVFPVVECYNS